MTDLAQNGFSINLNMAEGRIIFQALAELPFKYVYELIGNINHQANASTANDGDAQHLRLHMLSLPEMQLMIRALEELPFKRVNNLVIKLNEQIREQIES